MNLKRKNKNEPLLDESVKALFSLYGQYKGRFITIDILRAVSSILGAFLPYFIAKIATSNGDVHKLVILVSAMFTLMVVLGILWAGADYVYSLKIRPSFYKYREILFRTAWKRDYVEFVSKPSGKTAATITRVQQYGDALYIAYNWNFITLMTSVPILTGLLFSTIKSNSFAYLVFLIFVCIALKLQLKAIKKSQNKFADMNTTVDGNIFDSFANFVNVISFGARKKETKAFSDNNDELTKIDSHASTLMMTFWASASMLLRGCLWGAILFFNLYLLNQKSITFNEFILSVTVLMEFTNVFWRLIETFGTFTSNFANYKTNYNYLFERRNIIKEYYSKDYVVIPSEVEKPIFENSITFNNFHFAYPDRPDKITLENINLTIKKGEKIGVVGKSGSGKSTLVKLLLGFYEFDKNTLQVDGKSVSKEQLATFNCYVPQDTTLFQQSIEFNIAYAKNSPATKDEVINAAKKAHAHDFIMTLKDGYETMVGERGIKLSLGRRQRIALARAFLKDSKLLILDEATSSLDSKTESLVQESLEELWKERTVVAVAHRLSTLNNVDRIIVIDDGKIIEQGTKVELLALNGVFTELWNHQSNGMIIEDDENEVEVFQQY